MKIRKLAQPKIALDFATRFNQSCRWDGIFGDPRFGKNPRNGDFMGIGMDFPGMRWGSQKIPGYDFVVGKILNIPINEPSQFWE